MVRFDWMKLTVEQTKDEVAEGLRMLPNHDAFEAIQRALSEIALEELQAILEDRFNG